VQGPYNSTQSTFATDERVSCGFAREKVGLRRTFHVAPRISGVFKLGGFSWRRWESPV